MLEGAAALVLFCGGDGLACSLMVFMLSRTSAMTPRRS